MTKTFFGGGGIIVGIIGNIGASGNAICDVVGSHRADGTPSIALRIPRCE